MIEKKILNLFLKYKLRLIALEYNITDDNILFAIDIKIYYHDDNDKSATYITDVADGFIDSALHTDILKIDIPFSINYYVSYENTEDCYEYGTEIVNSIIKTEDSISLIKKLIINWASELYEKVKEDVNYKNKIANYKNRDIWLNNKSCEKIRFFDIRDKYGIKYGDFCKLDLNYKLITDF